MIPRHTLRRRRGSIYVIVLSATSIVVLAGLSGLASVRVKHRTVVLEQSWDDAGGLAQSAVEHALIAIDSDRWWRETCEDWEAVYRPEIPLGSGTMSWRLDDLVDSNLNDSGADPLRIYGRGTVGDATRVYSVLAWPTGQPLDVLRTAVHASGELRVRAPLDVRGGPASSNFLVDVADGQILGDCEGPSVDAPSNVSGTVTTPSPAKTMPAAALWAMYKALSTELRSGAIGGTTIESVVISPAHNPYKADEPNANGLYRIRVPSLTTFHLRNCRISGTLLVELSGDGSKFTMGDGVVLAPARPDFPALLIYAKSDLGTEVDLVCRGELNEFLLGTNFNPAHTPYYGDSDTDTSDVYPASITGLVHVMRDTALQDSDTTLEAPRRIFGSVIVDGDIKIEEASVLVHNPQLTSSPPLGYTRGRATTNLLVNGDAESGLAGWSATGPSSLRTEGGGHTGAARLTVEDRSTPQNGVMQDITGAIQNGVALNTDAWVRMKDDPEDVTVTIIVQSSDDGVRYFDVDVLQVQREWTRVIASHVPTWSGTLISAHWHVSTSTTNQDFSIDDAILEAAAETPAPRVLIVPGTWRADAND